MLTIEQLKARKRGIGGSDAAAVCGVSKWKTPLDVYGDKTSDEVVQIDNPIFERGHILEPLILALFERETGKQVKFQPQTLKHKNYQFMIANIDGYLPDEKALFEAKTSSYYAKADWGDVMTDQVPDDYFVQCQHYMAYFLFKQQNHIVSKLILKIPLSHIDNIDNYVFVINRYNLYEFKN